ncbi:hypothetical protein [uncultured Bacteroides sp.]|uniref:hypothetical protein n=1 Tax=Bacteroides sp. f07 TaxID=3132704 RepID=UPI00280C1DEA|nr:hypothetical protein [uncultured Bacteroides sp.]
MNKPTAEMLKKGYLLFPKVLFEEQIKATKGARGYFDAFILVLTHVNYSTTECCTHNHTFECRRGESVMSIARWAELFGWKRSRTRYFFNKMYEEGIIQRVANPYTTHIRIPAYDMFVGQKRRENAREETNGVTFETFWEKYHEVTQTPKLNIGRARREWKKLSPHERNLSLKNIDEYYDNLADTKYCMQASTYLSYKAFMNEYDY